MKSFINTIVINPKGNEPIYNNKVGAITTRIDGASIGSISIDAFEGQGETYQRRNDAEIVIRFGKECFRGTLKELAEKLSK